MTKPKLFTALLLVLFAAGELFAQRDSLCMRIVDEWDAPVPMEFWPEDIEVVGDYIYVATYYGLWVFSLSDSGILSVDTLLLVPPHHVTQIAVQDTIAYVGTDTNLVVLNIANPARPESLITYTGIIGTGGGHHLYINDTILYCTNMEWSPGFAGDIGRFNISDPLDVREIYTFSTETYNGWLFIYPYFLAVLGDEYNRTRLITANIASGDTIFSDTVLCDCSLGWTERSGKGYAVRDSFIFMPTMLSYVRSFMTNSTFDTLIYLDEYREPWYEGDDGGLFLSDSLLFVSWDKLLRVFNTSDPTNIVKIGEYRDTIDYRTYWNFAYIDTYLVATFTGGGRGIIVFNYPCTGCDGNCELDLVPEQLDFDVSPNPFNDRCNIRFSHDESKSSELAIFDVRGRKVEEKTLSFNTSNYVWDASNEASGVYLVVLSSGERKISRRLILMK